MAAGELIGKARVLLELDTRGFHRSMSEAEGKVQKFGKTAGVVGLALAGGLAVGLEKSAKAAIGAEASTARLDTAFKTAHLSAKAYQSSVADAESASRKLGFENTAVRNSLGSLIVATHSGKDALKDLSVAQDIARFKHVDLETATKALTMAMGGSQRAIKQLGLTIAPTTANMDALKAKYKDLGTAIPPAEAAQAKFLDKQATAQAVIALVSEKLHGQSQAFADTAAGGLAKYHAQMDNLQENLGKGLLPALSGVADALSTVSEFLANHSDLAKAAAAAVAALSLSLLAASVSIKAMTEGTALNLVVTKAATAAAKAWAAAQWLLNAALDANPIGLVIVAVAALSAGLYLAYTRSAKFREIISGAFRAARLIATAEIALILTALDAFMAGLQLLADAASHLPFIGGRFKGIANAIGDARERVRDLRAAITGLQGKTVGVTVNLRYSSNAPNRPGDGIIGADGLMPIVEKDIAAVSQQVMQQSAGRTGSSGGDVSTAGLSPWVMDDLANAHSWGLHLVSGYRPGAITSSGNVSLHSVGQAIDVSGSPSSMAGYAHSEAGRSGIAEIIYTPVGWWHPGQGWQRVSDRQIAADHYSHVHVGVRGGDGIVGASGAKTGDGWSFIGGGHQFLSATMPSTSPLNPNLSPPATPPTAGGGGSSGGPYYGENRGDRTWANTRGDLSPIAGTQYWAGPGYYIRVKMAPTVAGGGGNTEWIREDQYGGDDTSQAFLDWQNSVGGGTDGGVGGGGMSQAEIDALVAEKVLEQAAAFMSGRAAIWSSFAPNIFSPGPSGKLELGSASGPSVFYVKFEKPPADSYSWIRATSFAAGR